MTATETSIWTEQFFIGRFGPTAGIPKTRSEASIGYSKDYYPTRRVVCRYPLRLHFNLYIRGVAYGFDSPRNWRKVMFSSYRNPAW